MERLRGGGKLRRKVAMDGQQRLIRKDDLLRQQFAVHYPPEGRIALPRRGYADSERRTLKMMMEIF